MINTSRPHISSAAEISLESNHHAGACLLTRFQTCSEDAKYDGRLKAYYLKHYKSWLAFAREQDQDISLEQLIFVTGVDLTKDYAMMAFAQSQGELKATFSVNVPPIGSASLSAWGEWKVPSIAHKTRGPITRDTMSSDSPRALPLPSSTDGATTQHEITYNQCIFTRGFRLRERRILGVSWPKVLAAAAGPHDLGSGAHSLEDGPAVPAQAVCEEEEVEVVAVGGVDSVRLFFNRTTEG